MRVLIVGEAPAREPHARPSDALSGAAGGRLAALMGLSKGEFLEAFERRNLLERPQARRGKGFDFPAREAIPRALELLEGPWEGYLLLGRRVAASFGFRAEADYLRWYSMPDGKQAAIVPHPSGIVTWWNSAANRQAAAAFLRELLPTPQQLVLAC